MKLSRKAKFVRRSVLTHYVLLLLVLVINRPWAALPLFLFAWGIRQQDWRTHIWLCFVLLFYFLVNINRLAQEVAVWSGWLECALIIGLFTSAMFYCRWIKASDSPADSSVQGTS